jgi:hypothetical protein
MRPANALAVLCRLAALSTTALAHGLTACSNSAEIGGEGFHHGKEATLYLLPQGIPDKGAWSVWGGRGSQGAATHRLLCRPRQDMPLFDLSVLLQSGLRSFAL